MALGVRFHRRAVVSSALIISALCLLGSGVSASSTTFDGDVVPSSALVADASLTAAPGGQLSARYAPTLTSTDAPQLRYAADGANLTIEETRSSPVHRLHPEGQYRYPLPVRPDPPNRTTTNEVTLGRHEVHLLAPLTRAEWAILARNATTGAGLTVTGHCLLKQGRATSPNPPGIGGPSSGIPTVAATCDEASIELVGRGSIAFFNVTLRIDYTHPNGTEDQMFIRTGQFEEPDPFVPNERVSVTRVARLQILDADGRVSITSREPVDVRSPAMALQGRLLIPPGHGRIQWGEWSQEGATSQLQLEGIFQVAPGKTTGSLVIGALTSNAPSSIEILAPSVPLAAQALAAAGIGGAWILYRARFFLWAVLFTRIAPQRVLEHERRRLIVDAIRANAGLSVQELIRVVGLARGIVSFHLAILVQSETVVRRRFGRSTALYLRGTLGTREQGLVKELRRPAAQRLLQALTLTPGASQQELARTLGVSQSHVSKTLRRLREAGYSFSGEPPAHGEHPLKALVGEAGSLSEPAAKPAPLDGPATC